jgi:hypothetical protein
MNIEAIFGLHKQPHYNLFGGNHYAAGKQSAKDWKYNYETQPSFGHEYCRRRDLLTSTHPPLPA